MRVSRVGEEAWRIATNPETRDLGSGHPEERAAARPTLIYLNAG